MIRLRVYETMTLVLLAEADSAEENTARTVYRTVAVLGILMWTYVCAIAIKRRRQASRRLIAQLLVAWIASLFLVVDAFRGRGR